MSLNNFNIYNEYAYATMTEVLSQELDKFRQQTNGMLNISANGSHRGDFDNMSFFALMANSVKHRNPAGTASIASVTLEHKETVGVKVGRRTDLFEFTRTQFNWINQNPQLAGVIWGKQLAKQKMADYVNTAIGCLVTAISSESDLVLDITTQTAPANKANFSNLHRTAAKFGDRTQAIRGWVMHSTPLNELLINNIENVEHLFTFETVNVYRDPFGRIFIMTDSPELVNTTPTPDTYNILGLTENAISLVENDDFEEVNLPVTGKENISQQYQAEWSFNLKMKGFSWDKVNGGPSPNDAALRTSTNWDNVMDSIKDLPGVLLVAEAE